MLRGEQREFVIPAELEVGTKERGSIVEWVPQEDVLAHKVVDKCARSTVEKMVRTLMEDSDQREQICKSVDKFAKLARHAVSEGGSSCQNWEKLIHDLRKL
ncbi:hypothetical protein TB2_032316 [Malus domestica]